MTACVGAGNPARVSQPASCLFYSFALYPTYANVVLRCTMPSVQEKEYVGREHEVALFWRCLKSTDTLVLGIHGIAGIGKTWFVKELSRLCGLHNMRHAFLDLGVLGAIDYLYFLTRLRAQIGTEFFEDFSTTLDSYVTQLRTLYFPLMQPSSSALPVQVAVQGNVFEGNVGDIVGIKIENLKVIIPPAEMRRLELEMRDVLTDKFVQCMTDLVAKHPVVILLDAFEKVEDPELGIATEFSQWFKADWLARMRSTGALNLLLVLARRRELTWERQDREWRVGLVMCQLENWGLNEVTEYLAKRGHETVGRDIIETFFNLTRGHPQCLALAVDFWEMYGTNVSAKVFGEFRMEFDAKLVAEFLIDRILERLPISIRKELVAASTTHWFNAEIMHALLGQDYPAEAFIERVARYSFVRFLPSKGYIFHEIVRDFLVAKCRLETPALFREYHYRARKHFEDAVESISDTTHQKMLLLEKIYHWFGDDEDAGMMFFATVFEDAEKLYERDYAESLYRIATEHVLTKPTSKNWLRYYEARVKEMRNEWAIVREVYSELLLECHNDPILRARVSSSLGRAYWLLDYPDAAVSSYEQSARLYQSAGNEVEAGWNLRNIAKVYRKHGQLDAALEYCFRCLEIFEASGDDYKIGWALKTLGEVYKSRCEYSNAERSLERALDIWRTLDFEYGIGDTLGALVDVYRFRGRLTMAFETYKRILDIYTRQKDKHGIGWSLHGLGEVARMQGRLTEAELYTTQSLTHFRSMNYIFGMAWNIRSLGEIKRMRMDMESAAKHYAEAQTLFLQCGDPQGQAWTNHALGELALERIHVKQSLDYFQQALQQLDTISDEYMRGRAYRNMAWAKWLEKDTQSAYRLLQESQHIFVKQENYYQENLCKFMLASFLSSEGKTEEAKILLNEAREVLHAEGDVYHESLCLIEMEKIASQSRLNFLSESTTKFVQANSLDWLVERIERRGGWL